MHIIRASPLFQLTGTLLGRKQPDSRALAVRKTKKTLNISSEILKNYEKLFI